MQIPIFCLRHLAFELLDVLHIPYCLGSGVTNHLFKFRSYVIPSKCSYWRIYRIRHCLSLDLSQGETVSYYG